MNTSKDNLYQHVQFLTDLKPARNFSNIESLNKAANYIRSHLKKFSGSVEDQTFTVWKNEYTNVICRYQADKKQRLIVGAHYDVAGNQPGADDNASAVAGLLELARLIFSNKPPVDYGIEFVAYCLEEPPFFGTENMGSYVHAKSLHDNKTDVVGMVCFEMIGFFSDKPNSQRYPSPELAKLYPSTANFIVVVGIQEHDQFNQTFHKLMSKDSKIDVQVISFPNSESLAGLSDHRNYWSFGYPALMINDTSFVRNPNYHRDTDTIDTLEFEKMKEVVNSVYNAVVSL
jgi:Zn-dependent M28 family amino/carboxypeptidase